MPSRTRTKINLQGKSANEYLRDSSIAHGIYLERYKKSEVKSILGILEGVLTDAVEHTKRGVEKISSVRRRKSTEGIIRGANEIINSGITDLHIKTQNNLIDFAKLESSWQKALLNQAGQTFVDFQAPSLETLKTLVTNEAMQGELLKDWFNQLDVKAQTLFRRNFNIGMAAGDSIPTLVKRVDASLNAPRRDVETIVRTAVNDTSNKTRQATFEQNADLLDGWLFVATLDRRTSQVCRIHDGKKYPIGKGPNPPLHFNCRSTSVPIMKSAQDLNLNIKDLDPIERESMDGLVPADTTYPDWLKAQPSDVQDDVLGPARGQLFRDGKAQLTDFSDDTGQMYTLDQLAGRLGVPVPDKEPAPRRKVAKSPIAPQRSTGDDPVTVIPATPKKERVGEDIPKPPPPDVPPPLVTKEEKTILPPKVYDGVIKLADDDVENEVKLLFPDHELDEVVGGAISSSEVFGDITIEKYPDSIHISAEGAGTSDEINEITRDIYKDYNGKGLTIVNESFSLTKNLQGTGIGTRMFTQQVANAQEIGAKQLVTVGARGSGLNGYYTWARLGYNAKLPPAILEKLPLSLKEAFDLHGLMATAEGRTWWKENGLSLDMEFDLTPGSQSLKILDAYTKERELRAASVALPASITSKQAGDIYAKLVQQITDLKSVGNYDRAKKLQEEAKLYADRMWANV